MYKNKLDQLAHYLLYATIFLLVLNFTFVLGVHGTEFRGTETCDNIMVCFLICISFMAAFAGVVKVIACNKSKKE